MEEQGEHIVETEQSVQEFINFIQKRKVVMVEDVASQFRLASKDCIARIEQLLEQGRL